MNKNILKLFAILMLCFALVSVLVACGADGKDGADGKSPYMGEDGKLYVWDADKNDFVGYEIKGEDGKDGEDGEDGEDLTCGDSVHVWAEEGYVYTKHENGVEGIIFYPCTVCGVLAAELDKHVPAEAVVENTVAPDCVTDGSHDEVVYCSVCDGELSRETVTDAALGHTWGDYQESLYSSSYAGCPCEKETIEVRFCDVCNVQDENTIVTPATGHVYTVWTPTIDESNTESPCLQLPLEAAACDNCDHRECHGVRPVEGATAKGHHWGDWYIVDGKAPTADTVDVYGAVVNGTEGTIERKCTVCAATHDVGTETATIPALNTTDYTYTETPATCVDAGEGVYTIVKDETTLTVKVTLEALGHNYTNGVYEITKKPTYATSEEEFLSGECDGTVEFTCDVCGEKVEKVLPALGGAGTGRCIVSFGNCLDPVDSYRMPVDVDGYQVFVEFEQTNPNYDHDAEPTDEAEFTILVGDAKWYKAYWCTKCNHWIIVESYDEDPRV